MAKRVHMIREEKTSVLSGRKIAVGVCGTYTRSMKNATRDWQRVTCSYCLKHQLSSPNRND